MKHRAIILASAVAGLGLIPSVGGEVIIGPRRDEFPPEPPEFRDGRSPAQKERDRRNNLKKRDPNKRHRRV